MMGSFDDDPSEAWKGHPDFYLPQFMRWTIYGASAGLFMYFTARILRLR
jgi:hypothetical protein